MASLNDLLRGSKTRIKKYLLDFNIRLRQLELLDSDPYTYSLLWDTASSDNRILIIVDVINRFLPNGYGVVSVSRSLFQSGMFPARKWKFSFGVRLVIDIKNDEKTIRMGM